MTTMLPVDFSDLSSEYMGKPLLCADCLGAQLQRWSEERDQYVREHPQVTCGTCACSFRIPMTKLASLTTRGRQPLCRSCLSRRLSNGNHRSVIRR